MCVLSILLDCNKSCYGYCVSHASALADTLSHIKGICGIVESIFLGAIVVLLVPWGHQPKCTLNLINFGVILCKKKKRFTSQIIYESVWHNLMQFKKKGFVSK